MFLARLSSHRLTGALRNIMARPPQQAPQRARLSNYARKHRAAIPTPGTQKASPNVVAPAPSAVPESPVLFADLAKNNLVHPILLNTVTEKLGFKHMTPVQAATIHELLTNQSDCLAQAKTGTGKTLAFLLPAVQKMIKSRPDPGRSASLLVLAPTRELATQIAKEATNLLAAMPKYQVRTAIGGTNKEKEHDQIRSNCSILVATPGRLLDHLGTRGFSQVFSKLDTLVLDEADRLLDMGFQPSISQIVASLPDKVSSGRQGMLFSATITPNVHKLAHLALSPGYKSISTIQEGEKAFHEEVPQELVCVPTFADTAAALLGVLQREIAGSQLATFKTIVFVPTGRMADFYAGVLSSFPGLPPVSKLHSRLSQSARDRVTREFRSASSGIVVATDIIARGLDFPSVSNVIQAGIPSDRESYIHRLGRTARAGNTGRGTLILAEAELSFADQVLQDIPLRRVPADLQHAADLLRVARRSQHQHTAYQAWLGFYKSLLKTLQWTPEDLVREANQYAVDGLGVSEIPALDKKVIGKMGLKGVRGLVIANPARLPRA